MSNEKEKIVRRIERLTQSLDEIGDLVRDLPQIERPEASEKIQVRRVSEEHGERISDLKNAGYRHLQGDAGKANSEFFEVLVHDDKKRIVIMCPTFLRGPLNIVWQGNNFGGGY